MYVGQGFYILLESARCYDPLSYRVCYETKRHPRCRQYAVTPAAGLPECKLLALALTSLIPNTCRV